MNPIWVGSPGDVRHGDQANAANAIRNDSKYWTDAEGIVQVDRQRWEEAQRFESDGWVQYWRDHTDDRSPEHAHLFDQYRAAPSNLQAVAEFGCGPFTQLRYINQVYQKQFFSAVLIDPLVRSYLDLPHCTYKNGSLCNVPIQMVSSQAEEYQVSGMFDTVICINVLEHVQDAWQVLNNLHAALKPGGHLILGERTYDTFDCTKLFDIGHPIRIKTSVIRKFQERFEVLHNSTAVGYEGYFIGRKL